MIPVSVKGGGGGEVTLLNITAEFVNPGMSGYPQARNWNLTIDNTSRKNELYLEVFVGATGRYGDLINMELDSGADEMELIDSYAYVSTNYNNADNKWVFREKLYKLRGCSPEIKVHSFNHYMSLAEFNNMGAHCIG